MKAMQWSSASGGLEKNLKVNSNASLPKNANSLPKDSTLIKVAYTTLNPVDHKLPEMPLMGALWFSKPAIPCADFSGTVVKTTLPNLKPGDRVFGMGDPPICGGLGEYMVISGKEGVVKIPDGVTFEQASGIGICGLTAYQCIEPFAKDGGKVFINGGSGGTGTFGIQIAKAMGCRVTTTCSGANVGLCKSLGADEVIDYRTTNVVDHLKRQGTQYDFIVNNVTMPGEPLYWSSEHYLKPEGKYVTIAGDLGVGPIINMLKMFCLPTWLGGSTRYAKFVMCQANEKQYEQIAEWIREGKVKTVVEKVYDLEGAGEAFAKLKTGRTRGKLVVKVAGG